MSQKQLSQWLRGNLLTEFRTVTSMMQIYCVAHHQNSSDNQDVNNKGESDHGGDYLAKNEVALCDKCQQLLDYAETKLDRCPYGQQKPACNRCPIHCYKPEPKAEMKLVMRYAGPRMLLKHPILAIRHLVHEKRPVPDKPMPNSSNRHQRKAK